MLGILCLLSCLGAVFGGGIGYADPLLQYQLGARTSIAYGNNAFLARYAGFGAPVAGAAIAAPFGATVAPAVAVQEGIVAQPVATQAAIGGSLFAARAAVAAPYGAVATSPFAAHVAHTAPVAAVASPFYAARTAVAAPLVASAPVVSSVEHVPAVAQVPVTKYEAQPAVIQNVLDVANPKLATRKFEIRRPAIQKEFYDIEERVVVRPAGSAVVELDQPISKKQRGPTVVSPAGEPVAPIEPLVAVTPAPVRALPVHHTIHHQGFIPAFPAFSVQHYPIQGPTLQQPVIPSVGVSPVPSQPIGPSTPRPDLGDQPEFDDTESVSVENPEFGSARAALQQQGQNLGEQRNLEIQRFLEQSNAQAQQRAQQESQAQARAQQQQQQLQQQQQQQLQAEARVQQQLQAQARAEQEFQARARIQAQQQLIEQQQAFEQQQLQARISSQQATQRQSIAPSPAPVRENVESTARTGLRLGDISGGLARASERIDEIPSVRNLPEVELSNQARLIALLTERGSVSELRSADGLDGRVRARVLSATPAPLNAAPQDEKVSTRRVVVNRPIQTVQEVDVVEPFTKIERVAVNQPALIKTARLGVANVATAVPVHTYTHAHYAF